MAAAEAADTPPDNKRMSVPKRLAAWKRLTLAVIQILVTARQQMIVDHIGTKGAQETHEEKDDTPSGSTKRRVKKEGPMAQGIGSQLNKSAAHQRFLVDVGQCQHPSDALRCRGNQRAKWWTCAHCGARWARPEEVPASSATSAAPVTVVEEAPKIRTNRQGYPSYLPPPKGKPEQGPREVLVDQGTVKTVRHQPDTPQSIGPKSSSETPKAMPKENTTRGRTRMTSDGLRPIQRAKTPTGVTALPETFEINSEEEWKE